MVTEAAQGRRAPGQRRTFAEALEDLAEQHALELAETVNELKAENARLNERLNGQKPSADKEERVGSKTPFSTKSDSIVLLPGQPDDGMHDAKMPECKTAWDHQTLQVTEAKDKYETHPEPDVISGKSKRAMLFPDEEELKLQVKQAIMKPESVNVSRFYHESGYCQQIARSSLFENITFLVIFAVTIWIAIDTDLNKADVLVDAEPVFVVGANSFCLYFTCELLIRFGAFKHKADCFKDFSFVFDSLLVIQDVVETWCMSLYFLLASGKGQSLNLSVFRILRMAKLMRMARAARLMRALPEIAILVKGIGVATRSVFFTLFLLMLVIYVFAVMFVQITQDTDIGEQYFKNVPTAMNSLLLDGVLPDNAQIVNDMADQAWYLWPLIMGFLLLAALTVMNMLIGVLCNVVEAVAESEKEALAVIDVKEHLSAVMKKLDLDADGSITKAEFDKILTEPEAARLLHEVGVDVVGLVDVCDFIFDDYGAGGELNFEEFMNVMLDLRDSNTAKVKDVVWLQKLMKRDIQKLTEEMYHNFVKQTSVLSPQASFIQSPGGLSGGENRPVGGLLSPGALTKDTWC